jgi:hypothetical protein
VRRFIKNCIVLLAVLVLIVLIGGGVFAIRYGVLSAEMAREAYYVEWVAQMVVLHLDENDQRWPESWVDLWDEHAKCQNLAGRLPWSLKELSENVSVDWSINTAELKALAAEPSHREFRFISLKNGGRAHWSGGEPNQMVCDYLLGRRKPLSD